MTYQSIMKKIFIINYKVAQSSTAVTTCVCKKRIEFYSFNGCKSATSDHFVGYQ